MNNNPGKGGKGTEAKPKTPEELRMEAMSNLINSNNETTNEQADDKTVSFSRIVGTAWVLGLVLVIVGMAVYSFARMAGTPGAITPSSASISPMIQNVVDMLSQFFGAAGKEVAELLDETAPGMLRGFPSGK